MSNHNSKGITESFGWFVDEWIKLRDRAKETQKQDDWEMYEFFLKEAHKDFQKTYAGMTNEKWMEFMEQVIGDIKKELQVVKNRKLDKDMPF